jgi:hypothetical protein
LIKLVIEMKGGKNKDKEALIEIVLNWCHHNTNVQLGFGTALWFLAPKVF